MPLRGHCLNVGRVAASVNWVPFERQSLRHSGFGPANARNEIVVEAEAQVNIPAEIADLDPGFDGLVEKCSESVERDVIQHDYD